MDLVDHRLGQVIEDGLRLGGVEALRLPGQVAQVHHVGGAAAAVAVILGAAPRLRHRGEARDLPKVGGDGLGEGVDGGDQRADFREVGNGQGHALTGPGFRRLRQESVADDPAELVAGDVGPFSRGRVYSPKPSISDATPPPKRKELTLRLRRSPNRGPKVLKLDGAGVTSDKYWRKSGRRIL